ncbi:hypothetical protein K1T71_006536 [Dendrolimus kikuchii]|uniref:Uncharacterized protein n=1 Tax=Dendrolimus kikuchii TaxID=765133 RepID=A0ACC1D1B2_9NEOP|nr:hypothetical protein K1T71_006536 [Dendrolimus kikuchii]
MLSFWLYYSSKDGASCNKSSEKLFPLISYASSKNQEKPKKNDHVLKMSANRRNCAGCYERLRRTFNSVEAKKREKKFAGNVIKTFA